MAALPSIYPEPRVTALVKTSVDPLFIPLAADPLRPGMSPGREDSKRKLLQFLAGLALGLFLLCLALDFHRTPNSTFRVFYYAGQAAASGGDIYRSHDPLSSKCEYVYPPLFATAVIPLTHLSLAAATRLWLFFDVFLTLLSLVLASRYIVRCFGLPQTKSVIFGIAGLALLLGLGEVKTELATGQTDTVVLLSLVLALCFLDRLPALAGAVLGFSANLKYQTLIAIPYLLLRRRWVAAGAAVAATAAFAFLPALVVGYSRNLDYLARTAGGLGQFVNLGGAHAASTVPLTWIRSVSITSGMGRLLEFFGFSSSHAFSVSGPIALLTLAAAWHLYRKNGFSLLFPPTAHGALPSLTPRVMIAEWCGLAVAWLLFGPEVSRRHMYVLLLLHVVAAALLFTLPKGRSRNLFVVALVVFQLGLRLPPSNPPFEKISFAWNWVSGPGWCLALYYFAILSAVLVDAKTREIPAEVSPPRAAA